MAVGGHRAPDLAEGDFDRLLALPDDAPMRTVEESSAESMIAEVASVPMTFDDYQKQSRETAIYPTAGHPIVYPALGLAGEAGEVAEKVKKMLRDDAGTLTDERRAAMAKELGDVLWYLAQVASEAGLSLSQIAESNLGKLASRQARGKLQGSGDHR